MNQGRSSDIQRLEAHHPPLGGVGGVDDIRGIQDMGAGIKRKRDQPSSSSGKKQRTYGSQGLQSPSYRTRDELGLLVRMDRWCATIANSPDI